MEGSNTAGAPLAVTEQHIIEEWCGALRLAWVLARSQRLAELRGERMRTFDDQGLNPWSAECGRLKAFEQLVPALADAEFYPAKLRADAMRDAELEHEREIIAAAHARLDQLAAEMNDAIRRRLRDEGWSDAKIDALMSDPDEGEPDEVA